MIRELSQESVIDLYFLTKPLSSSRDFFPFSCVKRAWCIAFYEHFIVLPHHENSSSWRFPRNAIRGRRLLNFSTFRSVLFSGEFRGAPRRALYSPVPFYNNWISAADLARKCAVIARTRENNTADMPFASRTANYWNPTRIINGPFTRHSLPTDIDSATNFICPFGSRAWRK